MTRLTVDIREKRLAGRPVLGGLAFSLDVGEVTAVVGPSGCGKSTLLRLVAGLDREVTGIVRWSGAVPRLGVVFQQPRLLPWRTVRQNLTLAGADAAEGDRLLERLGLAAKADVWASHLSLGMARRLALARALAVDAQALLLDEPFASLDEGNQRLARAVLREHLLRRPVPTLLVTHDLAEAVALAQRVLVLSSGPARLLFDQAVPVEVRTDPARAAATVAALRDLAR
ncbi:ATP-binding cassette domain-containing protein [Nitrospirillum sp. BR 11164]|uniref:ATP-binding cassette domain-containing protein n=1 Tax=Nitrospirillum sp. BR 11164 TaxID=3104324 RepID=UPI002AFFD147|nr:ATP-binding cassette domain-containing protein [Nitrospirillum sp. BR 11164]MEA1648805.1 ATP-binding cassette domain-containing protein [Nitrospirillum sp. BR 11164]